MDLTAIFYKSGIGIKLDSTRALAWLLVAELELQKEGANKINLPDAFAEDLVKQKAELKAELSRSKIMAAQELALKLSAQVEKNKMHAHQM